VATIARGQACPNDGTLVTCIGDETTELLTGHCPIDNFLVTLVNTAYVAPVAASAQPVSTRELPRSKRRSRRSRRSRRR